MRFYFVLERSNMIRIGQSSDIHRLVENRKLILGGVEIEHTNFWHQLSVNLIEKVRKVYKPTAEMQEKWDDVHKKYVEEMAEIDRMLSL